MMKANLVAMKYLAFFAVLFGLPYLLIWKFESYSLFDIDNVVVEGSLPLLFLLIGIVLHELVHGIFFAIFANKGFASVRFGMMWKYLAPYAHCKEPLKIKNYTIALLAPLVLVGILPAIVGIAMGNFLLLFVGIFMSGGAAGDLMIYNLIKKENPEDYVQDHPSEAGCYIFRKVD